eukprot:CAMPEP_0170744808 /NCGR_PEP_ID=MMETSP0437-20130122/7973_1 /TAXON_ID=0 /ORGANISM="Sexangularia sp." /LENGTH=227 /DNA_ID=CAMNT_0011083517 /DNA_START=170 /DNA_END=850 /DNA_ORIENTATION=+
MWECKHDSLVAASGVPCVKDNGSPSSSTTSPTLSDPRVSTTVRGSTTVSTGRLDPFTPVTSKNNNTTTDVQSSSGGRGLSSSSSSSSVQATTATVPAFATTASVASLSAQSNATLLGNADVPSSSALSPVVITTGSLAVLVIGALAAAFFLRRYLVRSRSSSSVGLARRSRSGTQTRRQASSRSTSARRLGGIPPSQRSNAPAPYSQGTLGFAPSYAEGTLGFATTS